MRIGLALLLLAAPALAATGARAGFPDAFDWRADDSSVLLEGGEVVLVAMEGRVVIRSGEITLESDRGEYDRTEETVLLSGNVRLAVPAGEISTDRAFYDFAAGSGWTGPATFSLPPVFGRTEGIRLLPGGVLEIGPGFVSNCYRERPPVLIRVSRLTLRPGEAAVARSLVMTAGGCPVFYLPWLSYPLGDRDDAARTGYPFHVHPRYSSLEGFQLFTSTFAGTGRERFRADLDYRGRRGIGAGPALETSRFGESSLRSYHIADRLENANRYRIEARHRTDFDGTGKDLLLGEFHKFSDPLFIDDFFDRETLARSHRSFLHYGMNRGWYHAGLGFEGEVDGRFGEPRRLPDFTWQSFFRPAGGIHHREVLSLSRLTREIEGRGEETLRAHLEPEISLFRPMLGGMARPFLAAGATFYSRDREGGPAVRGLGRAGFNLDWRLSRDFGSAGRGFEHLLEPRLTIRGQTVSSPPGNFHDYDGLDRLESDTLAGFQLVNRFRGRSPVGGGEILRLDTGVDYSLRRGEADIFRSYLEYRPRPGLKLGSSAEYDFREKEWRNVFTRLAWAGEGFEAGASQAVHGRESNVVSPFLSFDAGPRYRFEGRAGYDLRASRFKAREVAVRRFFHCWEARLVVSRDGGGTGVGLTFSPRFFAPEALADHRGR